MRTANSPTRRLPVPALYDQTHAGQYGYRPDQQKVFEEAGAWRVKQAIRPAGSDTTKVHLLLIDVQKDFCFPEGSLYVGGRSGTGAVEDNDRMARFIYANLPYITDITCTMDTHFPYQIFFPSFWLDESGIAPAPHTVITVDAIREGKVRPNPAMAFWLCSGNYAWLSRQVAFYCEELEKAGKYSLYLWPPHCLLGSDGHALSGVIHEARLFHSFARGSKCWVEVKGGNTLTENYSVLAPEVLMRYDGNPLAQRNTNFIKTLLEADAVVIAGQAASHCVKSSIEDLLGEIKSKDEKLARKVYIMRDCMSSVAVPDPGKSGAFLADFTPQAEEALKKFEDAGMNLVDSVTPLIDWPGLNL